ncbi:hypothetical protein [Streptomyces sp. SAS_270]|uniref:hypothetical protein n=1 Tax=Streptomyces sp. SAS_270 TaxID=3412748 RepID=UPI00403C5B35
MQDIREGDLNAFRVVYRRHYPAAYAYAARCMRTSLEAQQIANDGFADLLLLIQSEGNTLERRFAGCLRLRLLDIVRCMAVKRCADEPGTGSLQFRAWVKAGARWPMEESGQLTIAWERLPRHMRSLLWHGISEQEKPDFISTVTGIPSRLVGDAQNDALNEFRRMRAELYLERLQLRDCRNAVAQLMDNYPSKVLDPDSLKHGSICAACRAVYGDLIHLDTRLVAQMPKQLLGWWPAGGYFAVKSATPAPLVDPPFLTRTIQRERSAPLVQNRPISPRRKNLRFKPIPLVVSFTVGLTAGHLNPWPFRPSRIVGSWSHLLFQVFHY